MSVDVANAAAAALSSALASDANGSSPTADVAALELALSTVVVVVAVVAVVAVDAAVVAASSGGKVARNFSISVVTLQSYKK